LMSMVIRMFWDWMASDFDFFFLLISCGRDRAGCCSCDFERGD